MKLMRYLAVLALLCAVIPASATVLTFTTNVTGNSVDFANAVTGAGGSVITLDFNGLPTGVGALNANGSFYSGVTMSGTGGFGDITNGTGPADGNTFSSPLSSGEGAHAASNYVGNGNPGNSFTVNFDTPTMGAGLYLIDLFNPSACFDGVNFFPCSPATLQAYTGANGTGTLLGTGTAADFNFQNNNLYFMGIVSTNSDIGSVVFTDNSSHDVGDHIGLDDFKYAGPGTGQVPEPGSLLLLGTGMLGLAKFIRRR